MPNQTTSMKRSVFIFIFFSLITTKIYSQNLFDTENTQKFAQNLFNSGEYSSAAYELERAIFMTPNNDSLKTMLLRSYRLAQNLPMGIARANQLFLPQNMPNQIAFEYGKLLLQNKKFETANQLFTQNTNLNTNQKNYLNGVTFALNNQWTAAQKSFLLLPASDYPQTTALLGVAQKGIGFKPKKTLTACLLSTLVPGLGRVYAKDWKDGLISLVFIGTMGFQAYRGYAKSGFESPRFWIYSTLTTGFYVANIYGSYQSARQYNNNFSTNLNAQVTDIFYTTE